MNNKILENALKFRDELLQNKVSKDTYNMRVKRAKKNNVEKFLSLQLGRYMAEVQYEG